MWQKITTHCRALALVGLFTVVACASTCPDFVNPLNHFTYNLSPMTNAGNTSGDYTYYSNAPNKQDSYTFYINICAYSHAPCNPPNAVCQGVYQGSYYPAGGTSLPNDQQFYPYEKTSDQDGVTIVYTNGQSCSTTVFRTTQLDIICDLNAGAGIVLSSSEPSPCYYQVKMASMYACANAASSGSLPASFSGPAFGGGDLSSLWPHVYDGWVNGTFSISNTTNQLLLQGTAIGNKSPSKGAGGSYIQGEPSSGPVRGIYTSKVPGKGYCDYGVYSGPSYNLSVECSYVGNSSYVTVMFNPGQEVQVYMYKCVNSEFEMVYQEITSQNPVLLVGNEERYFIEMDYHHVVVPAPSSVFGVPLSWQC